MLELMLPGDMAYVLWDGNGRQHVCKSGERIVQEKQFAAWLRDRPWLPQYPPQADHADWCLELVGAPVPEAIGRVYDARIFHEALPDLIDLLDALDTAEEVPSGLAVPRCPWNRLDDQVESWLSPLEIQAVLSPTLSRAVIELIKKGQPYARPCYQHGDFAPWHLLRHEGRSYCIDAEHASAWYPAYFDLAYMYVLVAARCDDRAMADRLLEGFMGKRGEKSFARPLFRALVARCAAGNLQWAIDGRDERYLGACLDMLERSVGQG